MEQLIVFGIGFLIIYLMYLFLVVLRNKSFSSGKVPVEVMYLVSKYKLDVNKIKYRSLLNTIGLILAFVISISITIVSFLESLILQLMLGFVVMLGLLLFSFMILGKIYKKKGMCKNV